MRLGWDRGGTSTAYPSQLCPWGFA